jgi:antirestriction protein ArdC
MPTKDTTKTVAKPLHGQVADKLIEALKKGAAPWQKPWNANGVPSFELPYNAVTGNRYKGINTFSLLLSDYEDPRWLTYKQAASEGWQVRKKESGTMIQYVKLKDLVTKRDERGQPILDAQNKPVKIMVNLKKPIITSAWVFNAVQIDGIPPLLKPDSLPLTWKPSERAENLVAGSKANVQHLPVDTANYSPLRDQITMPLKEQFDAPDKYYATLLHELGHWTGHPSRLERSIMNKFGTEDYAREELRAEIASLLIGQELQIGHDPGQHVAYVDSWIRILQDTPFEIHAAAADAEKIFTYLLDIERKLELKTDHGPTLKAGTQADTKPAKYLFAGDEIPYKDQVFKVLGHLKRGQLRMEESGTGNHFVLSKTDGLYASLLNAKNQKPNPLVRNPTVQTLTAPGQTADVPTQLKR